MDEDVDADDTIGHIEVSFKEIVTSFDMTVEAEIIPAGNGNVTVTGKLLNAASF